MIRWSHKEHGIHKQRPRRIPKRDELGQQIEIDGELRWISDPTDEQLIAEGWYYDSVPAISKYQRLTGVTWDDVTHTCGRSVEYLPIAEVAAMKRGEIWQAYQAEAGQTFGADALFDLAEAVDIIDRRTAPPSENRPQRGDAAEVSARVRARADEMRQNRAVLGGKIADVDAAEASGDIQSLIRVSWS